MGLLRPHAVHALGVMAPSTFAQAAGDRRNDNRTRKNPSRLWPGGVRFTNICWKQIFSRDGRCWCLRPSVRC